MARQLRIEFPGAYYHVLNRGVERRVIFTQDGDAECFLSTIRRMSGRHQVALLAYCLMPNHYHLLLRADGGLLRAFMRDVNGIYAQYLNRRLERVGPLFQGRYKAVLVKGDRALLALVRYIHRNPVQAGLVESPEAFAWSSCAAYHGVRRPAIPIVMDPVYAQFGGDPFTAASRLRVFTSSGGKSDKSPLLDATGGVVLGPGDFQRRVKRDYVPTRPDPAISRLRDLRRPGLEVLRSMKERVRSTGVAPALQLRCLLLALHRGTSLTLAEIAAMTGVKSGPAVSLVLHRLALRRAKDPELDRILTGLESKLRGSRSAGARP